MKKLKLILALCALSFSTSLTFSCTNDSTDETDSFYETATDKDEYTPPDNG